MKQSAIQRKTPLEPKRTPRKCRSCGERYTPSSTTQRACSPRCALALVAQDKAKRERDQQRQQRAETRVAKERLKTRSDHMREAQAAFNAMIRERDHGKPCISCGSTPSNAGLITGSRWDAGHYRSVGACPELRFEPLNCHAQCVKCNRDLSGNTVEYRIRLLGRIGRESVEWLEGKHPSRKYTTEELVRLKAFFRWMTREHRKARESQ